MLYSTAFMVETLMLETLMLICIYFDFNALFDVFYGRNAYVRNTYVKNTYVKNTYDNMYIL